MANVEIKDSDLYTEKTGQNTYIVHTICNRESTEAIIDVTEWPFDAKGNKIGKRKRKKNVKIPGKACVKVAFVYPSYIGWRISVSYVDAWYPGQAWRWFGSERPENPGQGRMPKLPAYPDNRPKNPDWLTLRPLVEPDYEHADGRTVFLRRELLERTSDARPQAIILFPTPYPMRVYTVLGAQELQFQISSIEGVPEGWECSALSPQLGASFIVPPGDLSRQGAIKVIAPRDATTGDGCVLRVNQDVVGMRGKPPYRNATTIPIMVLDTRVQGAELDDRGHGGVPGFPAVSGTEYRGIPHPLESQFMRVSLDDAHPTDPTIQAPGAPLD